MKKIYLKRSYYRLDSIFETIKFLFLSLFFKYPKIFTHKFFLYKIPPKSLIKFNLLGRLFTNIWYIFIFYTKIKKLPFIIDNKFNNKNIETDFKNIYKDWEKHIQPLVRNKNLKDFNHYKNSIKKIPHVFAVNDINLDQKFKINIPKNKFYKSYFKNQLANDMFIHNVPPQIRDSDQISMYFGIENRSPFLSKELFELAYSFRNNYLINKGYGKYIFRKAMKNIVNDQILRNRNKIGFNMNIQSIFKTNSKRFKDEIFKNDDLNKLIKQRQLSTILEKETLSNQESHMLFSILNVANFLDIYA